jgi:hypothetical protein
MIRTWSRQLWKRLSGGTNLDRPARRKASAVRLGVECLEARELLSGNTGLIGGGLTGDPSDGGDKSGNKGHTTIVRTVVQEDSLTSLSLTQWDVNQPYTGTVPNFGSAQATFTQATGLPPGLSAGRNATTITLSGTPTQAGTFPVYLEAVESDATHVTTYEGTFNLTINPALILGSLSTAPWMFGRAGSATIAVSGGTPAYSNLAVTGLPAGVTAALSGSTITLNGTPTAFGTFNNVAVSLKDSTGVTAQRTYSLTVAPLLSPGTLPAETAGQGYSATFSVTGGTGHYSFALASGTLPAGLALSSAGVLSGTATLAGDYRFTVRATDTATGGVIGPQSYDLVVNPAAPSHLVFTTQPPATVPPNSQFEPVVLAADAYGNGVAGVWVTLSSPALQTNMSPLSWPTDASGHVHFYAWSKPVPGSYTLTASAAGLPAATSNPFSVLAGPAESITVTPSRYTNVAGNGFTVGITLKDFWGYTSDFNGAVTLTTSDGQLTPTTVTAHHGVASANLTLYKAGTLTLNAAASDGWLQGASDSVTVTPAAPSRFIIAPAVTTTTSGVPFSVTVTVTDAYSNPVPTFHNPTTLSSSDSQTLTPVGLTFINATTTVPVTLTLSAANISSGTPEAVALSASAQGVFGRSGNITITPPVVTSLSTYSGHAQGYSTPYLQSGDSVTIYGAGFLPGTKVQFGNATINPQLLVTPTHIDPSGTWMTVNVPLFAASSKILVQIPGGGVIASPQTFTVQSFRNTYGFSFTNDGPFNFSVTEDLIDSEYGSPISAGDVIVGGILGGVFGAGAAVAADEAFAAAYKAFCKAELDNQGACYGLVLTSVMMTNTPHLINPTYGLPAGAAPTVFNLQNNAALTRLIEENHLAQFSAEEANYAAGWALTAAAHGHTAQNIHDQIAGLLQSGQHPIIGMTSTANHAVLAYDLEPGPSGDGDFYIDVYDPNRPYSDSDGTQAQASRILIDPVKGWSFQMQGHDAVSQGGLNDLTLMVTPSSVVSGHVTKPTTLQGLATIFFGSSASAPPAPQSLGQTRATDAFFATLPERTVVGLPAPVVGRPHILPVLPPTDVMPEAAAGGLKATPRVDALLGSHGAPAAAALGGLFGDPADPFDLLND